MNVRPLRPALFVLVALAAGCAPSGASEMGLAPVPASEVIVYESAEEVGAEFEVLSVLPQTERGGYGATRDPLDAMRAAAGRLGANGLLVIEGDTSDAQVRAAIAQGSSLGRTQYVAILVPAAE